MPSPRHTELEAHESSEDLDRILEAISVIGTGPTIMATDLGQAHNPSPVAGLHADVQQVRRAGFSQDDVELLAGVSPAATLGLDEPRVAAGTGQESRSCRSTY